MKNIIIIAILSVTFNVHAQFREIENVMSKGKQKGISIHIDSINKTMAYDAVSKTIGDNDSKVNPAVISFDELFFDNANISAISPGTVDIYAKFDETSSSILLFVDLGSAFADSVNSPKEAAAVRQLGSDITNKVIQIKKQNNIDSQKRKIKLIETDLKKVTDELKEANNTIKSNTKGAAKDDREVLETETKLQDEKVQIREIDSLIIVKEKEFNAFPLIQLKSVNASKNTALSKNRKSRKNLIKDNLKSQEKIIESETEILLNKTSLELVKEDKKATKKYTKANQKLANKITDEKLHITLNDARIKTINWVIATDSTVAKINDDSLNIFDEKGRKKEMKMLAFKKKKLESKTQKHQGNIQENMLESEQKKKSAEATGQQVEALKMRQAQLSKELEIAKLQLTEMEKK